MTTIADLGESSLIARLSRHLSPSTRGDVLVGVGDDAAVLVPPRGSYLAHTIDALVEHVHFERRFISAEQLGRRAVAVNVSDLAAMGARPSWLLLSLVLPPSYPLDDFDALVHGVAEEGRRWGAALVGGNLSCSTNDTLVVDIAATGAVRPRRVLRRDTARAGDELWLTGAIGASAAGLQMLQQDVAASGPCVDRYRVPTPRLREAWAFASSGAARAAIDLSDGLAAAVRQLAAASNLGATLDAAAVPVDADARRWFDARSIDPLVAAMTTSDDYELLFAVPAKAGRRLQAVRAKTTTPLTRIGVLTKEPQCVVDGTGTRDLPDGFRHFAAR